MPPSTSALPLSSRDLFPGSTPRLEKRLPSRACPEDLSPAGEVLECDPHPSRHCLALAISDGAVVYRLSEVFDQRPASNAPPARGERSRWRTYDVS